MHTTRTRPGIAVFGLHIWGEHIVRICQDLGVTIHGIDPDPNVRRDIAKRYPNILLHADARAVFHDQSVTRCVITAPSSLHYTLTKQALRMGKHVLVEKPMTQNVKEAEELVSLAKRYHRRLMVDHTYLFSPALKKTKQIISSDRIGRLMQIRSERSGPGPIRPDSSVLWDLAPHDISVAWLLTGRYPVRTRLLNSFSDAESRLHDADIELSFSSGTTFHGHVSWAMPLKIRTLTVIGTKAALTIEWSGMKEIIRYHPISHHVSVHMQYDSSLITHPTNTQEPLLQTMKYFLSSSRKPSDPLTDGTHALAVIRIISTLERSGNHDVEQK